MQVVTTQEQKKNQTKKAQMSRKSQIHRKAEQWGNNKRNKKGR